MSLRETDPNLGVRDVGTSVAVTSSPRLTLCPPGFRAHVEAILIGMVIPAMAYREHFFLVITSSAGQLVNGQTYSVSPAGHLRVRAADGNIGLFRRWRCLLALGPGVLRGVEFAPEARVVAVKPSLARRRRYWTEEPIGPSGNRLLRQQLSELTQREAGRT